MDTTTETEMDELLDIAYKSTTGFLKRIVGDEEMLSLLARINMNFLHALIAEGFSRGEALQIVVSTGSAALKGK